jgi:aminopeptidase N
MLLGRGPDRVRGRTWRCAAPAEPAGRFGCSPSRVGGCAHAWNESDPGRGARSRRARRRRLLCGGARHGGIPLGLYCRASLAEHLDADELFEVTKQGFDFFHRGLRLPVPVRQVRPAVRAGVQRRRDGERRRVTFLEDYVFRVEGHPGPLRARAETILHEMAHMWFGDLVTMRWWDDLWLNESFADLHPRCCARPRPPSTRRRGRRSPTPRRPGPTARTSCPRPTRSPPTSRPRRGRGQLRRHHLRQGRLGAQAAGGLRRPDEFLAGAARVLPQARLRQHHARDLLGALEETSGRDLSEWAEEWLQTSQVNTLRRSSSSTTTAGTRRFAIEQTAVPEHPTLRRHRLGVGLYDRGPDGLTAAPRGSSSTSTGERTEVPSWSATRAPPTWCWSTTTT